MSRICPNCNGMRVLERTINRTWWEVVLRHPAVVADVCPTCEGVGAVKGSSEEEAKFERKHRLELEERAQIEAHRRADSERRYRERQQEWHQEHKREEERKRQQLQRDREHSELVRQQKAKDHTRARAKAEWWALESHRGPATKEDSRRLFNNPQTCPRCHNADIKGMRWESDFSGSPHRMVICNICGLTGHPDS